VSERKSNRREFLRKSVAVGAGLAAPAVFTRPGWGRTAAPPTERIAVAHIGIGGRGSFLLEQSKGSPDVEVAAVCDVDRDHLEKARKTAGEKTQAGADYRPFLDRPDIQAVVIAAPDHWHALATIDAISAGKDVYVEKPLCTFLAEGRAMVTAARRHGRMVQVGINHRSEPDIREIAEIIRSGRIGKVRAVKCWMWENPVKEPTPPVDPPADLDWDRWLGPAPKVPYHPERAHYNFRWCRDYAGGYMTDWGVHMLNVVTLAMDVDHKGPETIEAIGTFAPRNLYDFPLQMTARFDFKDPDFTLEWIQPSAGGDVIPGEKYGMTFYGEAGELRTMFGGYKFYSKGQEGTLPAGGKAVEVPRSPGHFRNWLDSIRSRALPIADVEVGHRTTSLCQLGNIALFTKRPLKWDYKEEKFVGDEEAGKLLSREYREPYRPRGPKSA
jgi:myo-inositol 2-dehydrogenase / D-chiro-inositol 1-dehydrogenase